MNTHNVTIARHFDNKEKYKWCHYAIGYRRIDKRLDGIETNKVQKKAYKHRYTDDAVKSIGFVKFTIETFC